MNEEKARQILGDWIIEYDTNSGSINCLDSIKPDVSWVPWRSTISLGLGGNNFSIKQLEAIVWWMKNKSITKEK